MKTDIHPKWYPDAKVLCSCGATYTVGATQAEIRTDVCSSCHPFFTGEQRIVDTEGQVERFLRRLERREELLSVEEKRQTKKARRREKRAIIEIVDENAGKTSTQDQAATEVTG